MRRWLVWIAVAVAVPALVGGWLLRPGSLDSAYLAPDRRVVPRASARCSR